jgi:hypothetical protein
MSRGVSGPTTRVETNDIYMREKLFNSAVMGYDIKVMLHCDGVLVVDVVGWCEQVRG